MGLVSMRSSQATCKNYDLLHVDIEGGFGGSSKSLLELVKALSKTQQKQFVLLRRDGPAAHAYKNDGVPFEIFDKIF